MQGLLLGGSGVSGHWASNWSQMGGAGAPWPAVSATRTSEGPSIGIWRGHSSLDRGKVLRNLSLECRVREGTSGSETGPSSCGQAGRVGTPDLCCRQLERMGPQREPLEARVFATSHWCRSSVCPVS